MFEFVKRLNHQIKDQGFEYANEVHKYLASSTLLYFYSIPKKFPIANGHL